MSTRTAPQVRYERKAIVGHEHVCSCFGTIFVAVYEPAVTRSNVPNGVGHQCAILIFIIFRYICGVFSLYQANKTLLFTRPSSRMYHHWTTTFAFSINTPIFDFYCLFSIHLCLVFLMCCVLLASELYGRLCPDLLLS